MSSKSESDSDSDMRTVSANKAGRAIEVLKLHMSELC
jgi:hypothetical protein